MAGASLGMTSQREVRDENFRAIGFPRLHSTFYDNQTNEHGITALTRLHMFPYLRVLLVLWRDHRLLSDLL